MQTPTNVSLVLTDSSSLKWLADSKAAISYGGFYQLIASRLIGGLYNDHFVREFGDRLVTLAEHAHAFRRMDMVESISQSLVNLRLSRSHQAIGRYYQALCVHKFGRGNSDEAVRLLDRAAAEAPPLYRLKALQSLAGTSCRKGDYRSALALYGEAGRFASLTGINSPCAAVGIPRMIAVISGEEGNHTGALALLENLFPLAHSMRAAQPQVYYDYMNGLAVELCEVGRLEEARNASRIALASPFAFAYPEWRETREEIELRGYRGSRSAVALNQTLAVAPRASDARNQARQRTIAGNAEVAVTPGVPEVNNLVTLRTARHASAAAAPSAQSQPLARVIEFPSRTPSMSEENDKELDSGQKRRFVADRLYEMFMDALEDKEVDVELVEKLYKVYIEKRKKG